MKSLGGLALTPQNRPAQPKTIDQLSDLVAVMLDPEVFQAKLVELRDTMKAADEAVTAANAVIEEAQRQEAALTEREAEADEAARKREQALDRRETDMDAREQLLADRKAETDAAVEAAETAKREADAAKEEYASKLRQLIAATEAV